MNAVRYVQFLSSFANRQKKFALNGKSVQKYVDQFLVSNVEFIFYISQENIFYFFHFVLILP